MRPIQRPRSLASTVLDQLRASIVRGDFELGAPLSERQLSESLGVSKTPVREALAQLKMEGLVKIFPQRGAFVFSLSAREVIDLCELRLTLETAALRLAFARQRKPLTDGLAKVTARMRKAKADNDLRTYLAADTAFHEVLFESCGNPLFAEAYGMHSGKIAALRNHLAAKPRHTDLSFTEHVEMVDLLVRGEIEQALAVLETHIGRTRATYAAWIEDIAAADRRQETAARLRQGDASED
ncbi:GntR family transcriptional regulator [Labrys wisconsinensis]|uniref:DNA-binding GntR family transcriptional regulator n=1 Tax=Labrys wisconsinensis TaxID=425677 RepID=A0ABU0J3U6_9HYPH|nr:GntR family transcriptional regulator [Labrys wisconsinensis]MDQ0468941.1 DNA-binding GntR family transcriptional regulator [Labrys wisconsinensis]